MLNLNNLYMKNIKHTCLILFFLLSITLIYGQNKKVNTSQIKLSYPESVEEYSIALAEAIEYNIMIADSFGFELPKKIKLNIKQDVQNAFFADGKSKIYLRYNNLDEFIPGKGPYILYGISHEIGHICLIRVFPDNTKSWYTHQINEAWAHFYGSMLTSKLYESKSDSLWPIPYNYGDEGMPRFLEQIKDKEDNFMIHCQAWFELSKIIGFEKFPDFFQKLKDLKINRKNSLEVFPKVLSEFSSIDQSKVWIDKYGTNLFTYFTHE